MNREPRRFKVERSEDVSGVSGVGIVAYGVEFADGECVLRWESRHSSTNIYRDIHELEGIHGHGGSSKVVWLDE